MDRNSPSPSCASSRPQITRKRRDRLQAKQPRRRLSFKLAGEWLEPRLLLASDLTSLGQLPLAFEVNEGQTDNRVDFLARGNGYAVFLTPGKAVLSLQAADDGSGSDAAMGQMAALGVQLVGADVGASAEGQEELEGKTNYFLGADPSQWRTDVSQFGSVKYAGVYPGIDQIYHGNESDLRYDFVVSPGSDPSQIRLNFEGADGLSIDADGNLVVSIAGRTVVQHAPIVFQDIDGDRQPVSGQYVLQGGTEVAFSVGEYDASQVLTIDPTLTYSTYTGGTSSDVGQSIALDSAGNVYITGVTASSPFPTTTGVLDTSYGGSNDIFVTKLNAAGSARVFSTYIGGSGNDQGYGIAVDSSSDIYVSGYTTNTTFPTTSGAAQAAYGGGTFDAVVLKLSAAGSQLLYSTYFGGSGDDRASSTLAAGVRRWPSPAAARWSSRA